MALVSLSPKQMQNAVSREQLLLLLLSNSGGCMQTRIAKETGKLPTSDVALDCVNANMF